MKDGISQIITRGIENIFPSKEEATTLLTSGKKLRIYLGIDPTGPSLTLGHVVPLLVLKRLASLGHQIILLMGDFTARIGDPTDKSATRTMLSKADVLEHMKTYDEQIGHVLDLNTIERRNNSEWYEKMTIDDFMHLAAETTVQQMLTRDMFQKRMEEGKPIHTHELFYPFMQGYDTIMLDADGEVGGNDQTFNMLVGRDLAKKKLKKDKIVIPVKLLADSVTGKKMSKTDDSFVALDDEPNDMFGKIMAFPDGMIEPAFEMVTEVSAEKLQETHQRLEDGENPKNLKMELALEIVGMFHGKEFAKAAQEEFNNVFAKGGVPESIPEHKSEGTVLQTAVIAGIFSSNSEAHRKLKEGAISINGKTITEASENAKPGDVLRAGRKFLKII